MNILFVALVTDEVEVISFSLVNEKVIHKVIEKQILHENTQTKSKSLEFAVVVQIIEMEKS